MRRRGIRLAGVLGAGALLLVAAIWQAASPVELGIADTDPPTPEASATATGTIASAAALAQPSHELDDRPLFVMGRRPPPTGPAPVQDAPAPAFDRYAVLGVIVAPERASAIMRGPTGQTIHLRVGQTLEGWTLQSIAPARLIFNSAGQTQEIQVKSDKAARGQAGSRTNPGTPR